MFATARPQHNRERSVRDAHKRHDTGVRQVGLCLTCVQMSQECAKRRRLLWNRKDLSALASTGTKQMHRNAELLGCGHNSHTYLLMMSMEAFKHNTRHLRCCFFIECYGLILYEIGPTQYVFHETKCCRFFFAVQHDMLANRKHK